VIAIILVLCGILFAAGLTIYAAREGEWGLALFMGLITLVSLATAYVAFGCLGSDCLFGEFPTTHSRQVQARVDGDA
jgi:hypothetical protein